MEEADFVEQAAYDLLREACDLAKVEIRAVIERIFLQNGKWPPNAHQERDVPDVVYYVFTGELPRHFKNDRQKVPTMPILARHIIDRCRLEGAPHAVGKVKDFLREFLLKHETKEQPSPGDDSPGR